MSTHSEIKIPTPSNFLQCEEDIYVNIDHIVSIKPERELMMCKIKTVAGDWYKVAGNVHYVLQTIASMQQRKPQQWSATSCLKAS